MSSFSAGSTHSFGFYHKDLLGYYNTVSEEGYICQKTLFYRIASIFFPSFIAATYINITDLYKISALSL